MGWTVADIPALCGETIVVTGANAGIGLETAAALGGAGATVVMACRNLDKAEAARTALQERGLAGSFELLRLDLADQRQLADAAAEAAERFPRIDRLINNAGVMGLPRTATVDGFETILGTNHLGHFAFTGRLLPNLLATPGSRVVTVSSMSYRVARIRWDDLHGEHRYNKHLAYAQSKLANLLFAFELQRRLAVAAADTISLAVHPGFAATDILGDIPSKVPFAEQRIWSTAERLIPPSGAATSSLRAATSPDAMGGEFYGPSGAGGIRGEPVLIRPARRALDLDAQSRLWARSVELTGVDPL